MSNFFNTIYFFLPNIQHGCKFPLLFKWNFNWLWIWYGEISIFWCLNVPIIKLSKYLLAECWWTIYRKDISWRWRETQRWVTHCFSSTVELEAMTGTKLRKQASQYREMPFKSIWSIQLKVPQSVLVSETVFNKWDTLARFPISCVVNGPSLNGSLPSMECEWSFVWIFSREDSALHLAFLCWGKLKARVSLTVRP